MEKKNNFYILFIFTDSSRIEATNVGANVKFNKVSPPSLPKLPPPKLVLHSRRHPNFCPSANVKRIIAHSETLHADAMNENQLIDKQDSNRQKHQSFAAHVVAPTERVKLPLSKITSKLKNFGNDLAINDSDSGYITSSQNPFSIKSDDNIYEIVNINANNENIRSKDTNSETSINEGDPFNSDNIPQNQVITDGPIYQDVEYDLIGEWDTNKNKNTINEPFCTLKNSNSENSVTNETETVSIESFEEEIACNSQKSSLTESHLIEIKSESIEHNRSSSNFSTCDTVSSNIVPIQNECVPTIRPLSSVSISSTSSSSSSVSDENSANQNAISYLASAESLADENENKLPTSSQNLTVTELACLEIIDSERSYVCDLGQIIKGYVALNCEL